MAADALGDGMAIVAGAELGTKHKRRRLIRNRPLVIGAVLLIAIAIACLAAPLITSYDPSFQDINNAGAQPFTAGHILGTDAPFGRDMLSRILYGGRIDILLGIGATSVTLVVGSIVGLIAGYVGGKLDGLLMRIVDIFFAFPFLVLVLAIIAMLGPSLLNLFIAIWSVGWVSYARIIRGETLVVKKQEYILAARTLGYSHLRIMFRHILPSVISAAVIFSMVDAVGNILLGAGLGYLGLGVPPPTPEWGSMISDGQTYMTTQWWVPTLPGIAIVIVGISFSLIGDGLADILRPQG